MFWAVPGNARILPSDMRPADGKVQTASIRLRFSDTDVSDVLQALALRTHANIVFPSELKKPISLNVTASSVDEALRYIAAAAGLAYRQVGHTFIVATPADLRQALEPFGERETVTLNALAPDQAAKILMDALPFLTARPAGKQLMLIGAPEDLSQARAVLQQQDVPGHTDPQVNEVVTVSYTPAGQVAGMLKSMYPDLKAEVVGAADKPGGSLGLSGPRSEVEAAKETIHSVDVSTTPQMPERVYRTYNIKYSSAPVLKDFLTKADPNIVVLMGPEVYAVPKPSFNPISAVNLGTEGGGSSGGSAGGSSGGASGGAGGGGGASSALSAANGAVPAGGSVVQVGDRAKVLVLGGTESELDQAERLLGTVDVPPHQVMVEVKVIDTSPEKIENLGVQWSWNPFGFLEAPQGTQFTTSGTGGPPTITSATTVKPVPLGPLSRVPWTFSAVLNAMVQRNEAKLLANPKIQVIDDQDANIFIGETIRTTVSQASISGTTIQVLEFPVGIILLVHPRINADGNLTLHVHPVVSSVASLGSNGVPNTSSREAETTVMIKDGETMVIGGLIQDEVSKSVQEIPFLSKIPLIGELFRNRSTDHRHSDVLVFITPHIVK